jgi:uncharacterized protein YggE
MRQKPGWGRTACRIIAWYIIVTSVASAQEPTNQSISVSGRGSVKVPPTSVEILGTISSGADLATDALAKFRSAKDSAVNAIQKLDLKELTVETGGFVIAPPAQPDSSTQILMRSRQGVPDPPSMQIHESIRIRLKQIDKMDRDQLTATLARIMDAAKEAGVSFGPSPSASRISVIREELPATVTFMIDEPGAARAKAEAQAMQDAREKADRFVKLSGGRLGHIQSLRESYMPSPLRTAHPDQSSKLDPIELSVTLDVQFRLLSQ